MDDVIKNEIDKVVHEWMGRYREVFYVRFIGWERLENGGIDGFAVWDLNSVKIYIEVN